VGPRPLCGRRRFYSDSNQVHTNSNSIQFVSNFDRPKRTFPNSKNLKQNMVVKVLKKGTTFSIGTSLDSEWISNENLENFLGLEFNRITPHRISSSNWAIRPGYSNSNYKSEQPNHSRTTNIPTIHVRVHAALDCEHGCYNSFTLCRGYTHSP
jgi:hypothetical protein